MWELNQHWTISIQFVLENYRCNTAIAIKDIFLNDNICGMGANDIEVTSTQLVWYLINHKLHLNCNEALTKWRNCREVRGAAWVFLPLDERILDSYWQLAIYFVRVFGLSLAVLWTEKSTSRNFREMCYSNVSLQHSKYWLFQCFERVYSLSWCVNTCLRFMWSSI